MLGGGLGVEGGEVGEKGGWEEAMRQKGQGGVGWDIGRRGEEDGAGWVWMWLLFGVWIFGYH